MSKFIALYRDIGFVAASCYLVNLVTDRVFGRRVFYYYAIVAQPVVGRRMRAGGRYTTLVADCWDQLEPHAGRMATPEPVIRARFAQPAVCVLLLRDDTLVAYAWLALAGYFEDEVRCHFRPRPAGQTAWDFDVYVLPDQRSTLTFARLWDAVNGYLDDHRRLWTLSRISRFNSMSIASHARMGAVTMANVMFLVLGPLQILMSRRQPWLDLSLSRAPALDFDLPASKEPAAS